MKLTDDADGADPPRHSRRRSRASAGRCARILAALVLAVACGSGGPKGPEPPIGNRRLVFQDDFDGSRLDTRRWATCYDWNDKGCTNSGNPELEWYLPGQVSVRDGAVTLSAARRSVRGSDGKTYPWVSGMISTGRDNWDARPRRTFTYGYFEASIRVPAQQGMFPAFWLMPASRYTPPELDIMEFYGDNAQRVQMHVRWRGHLGEPESDGHDYGPVDFPAEYHRFGLLWTAHEVAWYVDGERRFRVTQPERVPHVPMEVLLDLAVGVPKPPPRSVDSARMNVDWVRVWQD